MAKTVAVTLGGAPYEVPRLNMAQLEEIASAIANLPAHAAGFAIMRIALSRAVPPLEDFSALEPEPDEILDARTKIMELSGLAAPNPPVAPKEAGAT